MSRRLPGVVLSEMAREVSHSVEPVQKLGCSSDARVDAEHDDHVQSRLENAAA